MSFVNFEQLLRQPFLLLPAKYNIWKKVKVGLEGGVGIGDLSKRPEYTLNIRAMNYEDQKNSVQKQLKSKKLEFHVLIIILQEITPLGCQNWKMKIMKCILENEHFLYFKVITKNKYIKKTVSPIT
jgi:hypothetical protein